MGIPHLIAQIKPYAKRTSWQTHESGTDEKKLENLIIDGPSLAYYIYHQCLATHIDARNALDAIPSYTELGNATVAWLETLEMFGLHVKHIFFDGHLPKSKTSIRYDRLSKYLLQLKIVRSSTTRLAASGTSYYPVKQMFSRSSSVREIPTRLTALPAAPFLVPSIMEALFASQYGSRTRSVPCEAEVRCTNKSILEDKDIILTSDSDLILLVNSNRVIFFSDIDTKSLIKHDDTLYCEYYLPADLREKLECPDLIKLAYLLTLHPHRLIKELAKQANQATKFPDLEQFRAQFLPENQYSRFASYTEERSSLGQILRRLDPRTSEFVQQWGSELGTPAFTLQSPSQNPSIDVITRHMYLPFLIDDPTRSSAWKPTQMLRQFAYSVLALYGPRFTMMEVDRRGDRIIGTEVALVSQPLSLVERCTTLQQELSYTKSDTSDASAWKLIALTQVLRSLVEESVNLPSKDDVLKTCFADPARMEWTHVHFSAQIEAYLYSLRMLSQILEVYLAAEIKHDCNVKTTFEKLLHTLQQIPPLQLVINRAGGGLALDEAYKDDVSKIIASFHGREDELVDGSEGVSEPKRKKKRQRRATEENGKEAKAVKSMTTNMYSLLQDEG